jgi:hypothetical protein
LIQLSASDRPPAIGPAVAGAIMPKTKSAVPTSAAAWLQARECARLASITTLANLQARFLRLRDSWIIVATELEQIEGEKFSPTDETPKNGVPGDRKTAKAH